MKQFFCFCLLGFRLFSGQPDLCVMGVGYCVIDQFVQVDESVIQEHVTVGKGGSLLCELEKFDRVLKEIGLVPKNSPGGSAANTIRALTNLGQPCCFLGPVGHDIWGEAVRQNFSELGIGMRLKEACFTGRVLCLVSSDGQRSFLAHDPTLDRCFATMEDIEGVQWIHFEARSLMINDAYIETLMQLAYEHRIGISLDLSSFNFVEEHQDRLKDLIWKYATIVFCNEDEVLALTGLHAWEGCLALQQMCSIAVVTLGPQGCLVGTQGIVKKVDSFPATVLDTTAAGDYFTAGFLYRYFRGDPLDECGRLGNRLGGAIVEVLGTELPHDQWVQIAKDCSASI